MRRRAWFRSDWSGWHYPDPDHPASRDFPGWTFQREFRCRTCGAPTGAACVTKAGKVVTNHSGRGQA